MARLYGKSRRDHRDAVFPGRLRVFYRSDFSRVVSDGVESSPAVRSLAMWRARGCERDSFRHLRRHGEFLDEFARWFQDRRWQDHRHRSDRRNVKPRCVA